MSLRILQVVKASVRRSPPLYLKKCYCSKSNIATANVYVSTCQNIYYNLALENWIYKNVNFANGCLMLLWRNQPCVVIGRHQNVWAECDLTSARKNGVEVARRNSGGGAVYHDLGNLNITFFTDRNGYDRTQNLNLIAETLQQHFNLNVNVNHRDDLVAGDHKISGTAAKLGRDVAYHHCTLLLNVDMSTLKSLLQPSLPGLVSRATESVKVPCVNLNELKSDLQLEDIMQSLSHAFLKKNGARVPSHQYVDPTNEHHFPGIFDQYQDLKSHKWIFDRTPKFSISKTYGDLGDSAVDLSIIIEKGKIASIDISAGNSNNVFIEDSSVIVEKFVGLKFWSEELSSSVANWKAHWKNTGEDRLVWLAECLENVCGCESVGFSYTLAHNCL